jgi:type I restriction enzyme R subunit
MKSNFQFLKNEWREFFQRAAKAEMLVITDPRTSLTYARMALEIGVNWMYGNDHALEMPHNKSLDSLIRDYAFRQQVNPKLYDDIHIIRKVGNLAIHNKAVSVMDSEHVILKLFYFCKWFAHSYSTTHDTSETTFDFEIIPKEGPEALTKRQLDSLQKKLDNDLEVYQQELEKAAQHQKELEEKNKLLELQLQKAREQIEQQKADANEQDQIHHPRNEQETRKYFIDVSLREAGWDLQGVNDKEYKVDYMPASTNKSETGFVDYVLWDDDGKPLAVIEAKNAMVSAKKGENQAQLYADSLEKMFQQRPVMFYSNGYETYFWDDCFYKQARKVEGFYTRSELQTLIYRRENRKDIRKLEIDTDIVERHYQLRSIRSIAEHLAGNDKKTGKLIGTNRGALLVLATGTGKTRTAIAFSKLLFEAHWAKRILFLADRISLVNQAMRNFVKFLPEYSAVNLLKDKEKKKTRLVFSTYNTLMNLIDGMRNGGERFYGAGHFDLIIIDEAHRSIYMKYKAIFEYFDAIFLGLTATPKSHVDKNTFEAFDLPDKTPTDEYSFEEAVTNRHLVPYKSIEVPTKFRTKGIKYKDLSEAEKEEFEKEVLEGAEPTGEERVDPKELDKWLFNKDTTIKTLRFFLKNCITVEGGDEPGKTIFFARSIKHANFLKDMFLELDKELYGNDYVKVIVNGEPKAEEFLQRFCDDEKDHLPQIAISVDMLDTGIDAPKVVNLVFYKPVKSYTKFWQMIGRGSRLRKNLFGQGLDKKHFLIFDLCGNFDFFEENPEEIRSNSQISLTALVFNTKLHLAQYLGDKRFRDNKEYLDYRKTLLDEMYKDVSLLDKDRFEVRMKMEMVLKYGDDCRELWNHLGRRNIKEIKDNIAALIKPQKGEDNSARFYDKLLYMLINKRAEAGSTDLFIHGNVKQIKRIAKISKNLLEKSAIPQVKEKEHILRETLDELFWKQDGINHLEHIRKNIRLLVKYLDPEDTRYVTTNFEDELYEDEVVVKDKFHDNEVSEKVHTRTIFENSVFKLEQKIRENKDHITIHRIINREPITREELQVLEQILFDDNLKKETLEKELGKSVDLVSFITGLLGLSQSKVDQSFAKFINEYQLNSVQIEFLNTVKKFLTKNGTINPEMLYDSPFIKYHNLGIEGVFNDKQTDEIFRIINGINEGVRGVG